MSHYAVQLIEEAKQLHSDVNDPEFTFEEALGQVIGAVIFYVDAELYKQGTILSAERKTPLHRGFESQVNQWFK